MWCIQGRDNAANQALLEAVNQTGKAFLVGTELGDRFVLRMAIGATATQALHVDHAWELLCAHADKAPGHG